MNEPKPTAPSRGNCEANPGSGAFAPLHERIRISNLEQALGDSAPEAGQADQMVFKARRGRRGCARSRRLDVVNASSGILGPPVAEELVERVGARRREGRRRR